MAALGKFASTISPIAPPLRDPEMWSAVNDLYLALANLVTQLNDNSPVMMSPNGHFWKATISNAGVLTWSDVGTLRP